MLLDGITPEAFISMIESKSSTNYTDEQRELIKSFGEKPTFCFADPGTGKTFSAVGGLLFAELYRQIPGSEIYAMSFTRLASGELAVRHSKTCDALGMRRSNVNFSTLHSLCQRIISENYRLLDMDKAPKPSNLSYKESFRLIEESLREWGIVLKPKSIRNVISACKSFNSALIFDRDNVVTKAKFKECNVSYETFDRVRGLLFSYSLLTETINVSDIMLYTLMLLEKHPEISEKFKAQCKLMLIDEAQDLSLLHLRIISKLTDNPVFIGDMKQQIYAFNGACQEIIQEFFNFYPNSKTLELTKSFRCKDEIAEFATKIILPNKIGGENFKGNGHGGSVSIHIEGVDYEELAENLRMDFITNGNRFTKSYLFLFRNNISAIPIVETLYNRGVPFIVNKYTPAYEVPVIAEMCEILRLVASPKSAEYISALKYLIPEFLAYPDITRHPLYKICKKNLLSFFEVNYKFDDEDIASDAMYLLMSLREMMDKGASVHDLFGKLYEPFYRMYLERNLWKLEADVDYYLRQVEPLVGKTFDKFILDEVTKDKMNREQKVYGRAVRCYTMHGSKGLEADIVYIIDANEGIIPNVKELDKMVKLGCELDAARSLREERSLCYVACTRAKEELHIIADKVSPILLGEDYMSYLDSTYNLYKMKTDDVRAFIDFVEVHGNV